MAKTLMIMPALEQYLLGRMQEYANSVLAVVVQPQPAQTETGIAGTAATDNAGTEVLCNWDVVQIIGNISPDERRRIEEEVIRPSQAAINLAEPPTRSAPSR